MLHTAELIKILQRQYMPVAGLTWVEEGTPGNAVAVLLNGHLRSRVEIQYDPDLGAIVMKLPHENFTRVFVLDSRVVAFLSFSFCRF